MGSNTSLHKPRFRLEDPELEAIVTIAQSFKINVANPDQLNLYIKKQYESLEKTCKKKQQHPHFNLLGARDKILWLIFYFFYHRAISFEAKYRLSIPWPLHPLAGKVKNHQSNRFETLLFIELIAHYQGHLMTGMVINLSFLKQVLTALIRKGQKLVQQDVDYVDLAHKIPDSVLLSVTKQLDIYGNGSIYQLPDAFAVLPFLEKFVMKDYHNQTDNLLPPSFFGLKNITDLTIINCQLTNFHYNFETEQVFSLKLPYNQFAYIPNAILKFTDLKTLDFSHNQLHVLPEEFKQFEKLQKLDLSGNKFSEFPLLLMKMESLNKINFQNNRLVTLPPNFIDLYEKKQVDLRDNWLTTLPQEAEYLIEPSRAKNKRKKRPLLLLGNPLEALPEHLCPLIVQEIKQVTQKDLSPGTLTCLFCWANFHPMKSIRQSAENKLSVLISGEHYQLLRTNWQYDPNPGKEELFKFVFKFGVLLNLDWSLLIYWLKLLHHKEVKYIDLSGINVPEIPFEALKAWPKLKSLRLTDNALQTIGVGVTRLENLQKLYLNRAGLKHKDGDEFNYTLPLEISHLDKLNRLDLQENQIQNLPPGIGLMDNLKELNLSNNRLELFPVELCELDPLEKLDLSHNQIEQVPEDIIELEQLRTLYLSDNNLKELPSLPSLTSLSLDNNLFEVFLLEILSLTNLETLKINQNLFIEIPSEISQLTTNLKELWISKNQNTLRLKDWLPKDIRLVVD